MESKNFTEEAIKIVDEAKKRGIILRVLGAVAFRIHCPNYGYIQEKLGRFFTDVDFVSYSQFKNKIRELFIELGYNFNPLEEKVLSAEFGINRFLFLDKEGKHIDIFFDKLVFSHTIPLKGRLEKDYPTMPLAELLLEKMQIIQINKKDVIDSVMLLREHQIGDTDHETINGNYIAKLTSDDWGLWKTVTSNLEKTKNLLQTFELDNDDKEDVSKKIELLLDIINKQPKSAKWKMRALVGEKKKWYNDVEEMYR
ncbi:MAG: hypothetical protein ACP5M8_08000 [Caldisphaera sp.]